MFPIRCCNSLYSAEHLLLFLILCCAKFNCGHCYFRIAEVYGVWHFIVDFCNMNIHLTSVTLAAQASVNGYKRYKCYLQGADASALCQ